MKIVGITGDACLYPTTNCSQTTYPSRCHLSCSVGYTLKGDMGMYCESNGLWSTSKSFCMRDNEPPTDVSLNQVLNQDWLI